MQSLRQYIISVICCTLICGILSGIVPNNSAKKVFKLLCGLFLTITVVQPLSKINLEELIKIYTPYAQEAQSATSLGTQMATDAFSNGIKEAYETYILNKAAALNVNLHVDIQVDENYLPVQAEMVGNFSPYVHQRLETILESDLGIKKENQLWIG